MGFALTVVLGKELADVGLYMPFVVALFSAGASAALVALAGIRGELSRLSLGIRFVWLTLFYAIEIGFFFAALSHGSASTITLLFFTYPVWVGILAAARSRRLPTGRMQVALVASVMGAALIVGGGGNLSIDPFAITLSLVASLLYGGYLYLLGAERSENPILLGAAINAATAVGLVGYSAIVSRASLVGIETPQWVRIIAMSITQAVGILCLVVGTRRIGAVRAAVISVAEPLFVASLAILLLGERPGIPYGVGACLVVGSLLVSSYDRTGFGADSVP
jgi:drug/metabolite transporter (DMT)-like permease